MEDCGCDCDVAVWDCVGGVCVVPFTWESPLTSAMIAAVCYCYIVERCRRRRIGCRVSDERDPGSLKLEARAVYNNLVVGN